MSVTIIGCGWLGFPLGKELISQGYLVSGSVRKGAELEKLREAQISPFLLNLENSTEIPNEIKESTDILVISIPPMHRDEPKKFQNVLNALLNQFSSKTRVIFTSSTGIYPKVAGDYSESFKFSEPQDSSVLFLAEETIRQSKKEHVIFRLGGLIGPDRHPIRFLKGRKNVKNPHGPINFVHQGDCIRAIMEAIANKGVQGTFNVVYPNHPTRKEYYSEAAKHYGFEAPSFKDSEAVLRLVSSEKIMRNLMFHFKFKIDIFPKLE